jgi:hypothetical protein
MRGRLRPRANFFSIQFVTTIAFYSLGEKGIGTWIRTPGARNPQQRIEIIEPFRYGEIITTTATTTDKFTQRGKRYLQMLLEFHNERDALKARAPISHSRNGPKSKLLKSVPGGEGGETRRRPREGSGKC